MKALEERFDRERISNDLRYDNLDSFIRMQWEELAALAQRVEELERDAAIHPLAKLVGKKAKKID